jgi:hypothetical protein
MYVQHFSVVFFLQPFLLFVNILVFSLFKYVIERKCHHLLGRHTAYKQKANQSSTGHSGDPGKAVDAEYSGYYRTKPCSHTYHYAKDTTAFWLLNYDQPQVLHLIEIYNRDGKLFVYSISYFSGSLTVLPIRIILFCEIYSAAGLSGSREILQNSTF